MVLRANKARKESPLTTRLCYFTRSYSTLPPNMPGVVSLSAALIWVNVAVPKVPVDCRIPSFSTQEMVVREGLPEKSRVVFVTKKLSPFRTISNWSFLFFRFCHLPRYPLPGFPQPSHVRVTTNKRTNALHCRTHI